MAARRKSSGSTSDSGEASGSKASSSSGGSSSGNPQQANSTSSSSSSEAGNGNGIRNGSSSSTSSSDSEASSSSGSSSSSSSSDESKSSASPLRKRQLTPQRAPSPEARRTRHYSPKPESRRQDRYASPRRARGPLRSSERGWEAERGRARETWESRHYERDRSRTGRQDRGRDQDRSRDRDRDRDRDRGRGWDRNEDRGRDRGRGYSDKDGRDSGRERQRNLQHKRPRVDESRQAPEDDTTTPPRRNRPGQGNELPGPPPRRDPEHRGRRDSKWSQGDQPNNGPSGEPWGTEGNRPKSKAPPKEVEPDFGLSGALAEETNKVNGVVLVYSEPPEASNPTLRWRLYTFKGGDLIGEPLHIHRQSSYLFGRERKVADIPADHPSCSKQHAVLQFRRTTKDGPDGMPSEAVRPYLMDLGSTNGTFINNERLEAQRFYELMEKDVIKLGNSSREYVLLHEGSLAA